VEQVFASTPNRSRSFAAEVIGAQPNHGLAMLGGFRCLGAKLDNFSGLPLRSPFQRFPENRRYVKVNHLCHDYLLVSCLRIFVSVAAIAFHLQYPHCISVAKSHNRSLSNSALYSSHNDDSGFCVLRQDKRGGTGGTTVIGSLPSVRQVMSAGERVSAEECWVSTGNTGCNSKPP
jgi:hypothetical protein